ncbi:hypothetical protein OQA88_7269 [Cercophora sp. LCS_1]
MDEPPQSTQTRKRQLDSDDDKPQPKRARLTRKNLAAFDKMGKKKTSDDDSGSTETKTTSTTSSGFAIKARNNGILDPRSSKPPKSLNGIRKRYAKSRATASPPESVYNDYVDRIEKAGNEATIVVKTSELLKRYPKGYSQAYNRACTNLPTDVGFNNGLSTPRPDFVEGLEAEEHRPFPIDGYIPGVTLYQDDPYSITLPQIAGEWKGPAGDMREARLQSAYDGAAMVHARSQALAYMGKADPAGHAEITTFTTDGTNLNLFAHHATLTEEGTLEYHQYPIKSINLIDSYQGYKEGRKHLRNAQDYAREQSYALKDQLQEYYKQQRHGGIELDAYEDEGDCEVVEHQPVHQPTPPTSSKHKSSKTHSHHSHHSQHSQHSHSTPHLSEAPPTTHDHAPSSGQKRKAPSSQGSPSGSSHPSKHMNYWTRDRKSGRFYHKHSDGTISRLEEEEDDDY